MNCIIEERSSRYKATFRKTEPKSSQSPLDPVGVGAGFGRRGGQGAQPFDNTEDLVLQRPLLVRAGDTGRAGGQLNAVVVLAIREPFQIGMRRQVRVRVEGHQTDVAGL